MPNPTEEGPEIAGSWAQGDLLTERPVCGILIYEGPMARVMTNVGGEVREWQASLRIK